MPINFRKRGRYCVKSLIRIRMHQGASFGGGDGVCRISGTNVDMQNLRICFEIQNKKKKTSEAIALL